LYSIIAKTGASSGAFFETFVVTEILKSYYHNGKNPQLSFFRDSGGNESTGYGCEICLTPDLQLLSPDTLAISVWDI